MAGFDFCPNPICDNHLETVGDAWYERRGSYRTQVSGRVVRYRCRECGKWFSDRTFSLDFHVKKKIDYRDLLQRHIASSCGRAIARSMGIAPKTVQNRLDRLARQAIAAHVFLQRFARKDESVCIDAMVSFDVSQYFPSEITMSITSDSRFILDISHASRRRSGRKSRMQAARAGEIYARAKIEKNGIKRAFIDILDSLAVDRPPETGRPLVITTDEKWQYREALESHSLFRNQDENHRIVHRTVSSKMPRTYRNPLFASNYLEREIRKDQANHHRESVCFPRSVANALSRLACYIFHHNYLKKYHIKTCESDTKSHGEVAGIPHRAITKEIDEAFAQRRFLSRCSLPITLQRIWKKSSPTPLRGAESRVPAYALE